MNKYCIFLDGNDICRIWDFTLTGLAPMRPGQYGWYPCYGKPMTCLDVRAESKAEAVRVARRYL